MDHELGEAAGVAHESQVSSSEVVVRIAKEEQVKAKDIINVASRQYSVFECSCLVDSMYNDAQTTSACLLLV